MELKEVHMSMEVEEAFFTCHLNLELFPLLFVCCTSLQQPFYLCFRYLWLSSTSLFPSYLLFIRRRWKALLSTLNTKLTSTIFNVKCSPIGNICSSGSFCTIDI